MEPVNFSTSKFCKERKRERGEEREGAGGEIESSAEERGVWSRELSGRAGFIVGDFFGSSLRSPWAPGGGGGGGSLLPRWVRRGARWAARRRDRRRLQPGTALRSLFLHQGDLCSRPLPHPGLSLLPPPPTHPAPTGLSRAAPPPARTRRAPSPHTHGLRLAAAAKFRPRSPPPGNPAAAALLRAVTLNFPSAVTHSLRSLLLPPSFLRPPPRLFFKKSTSPPTTTPIRPALPILRAPPSSQQQQQQQ